MGGAGWLSARERANAIIVPVPGGVYREGILSASPKDAETAVSALTKVGLVELSATGELVPGLATSWELSPDSQTVKITLDNRLTATDALQILEAQTEPGYWKDATMTVPEPQVLQFQLPKPWAGFVTELSRPVFPYGAYKLQDDKKDNPNQVAFIANASALKEPLLEKIELTFVADPATLERGLRKHQFDGAYFAETQPNLTGDWQTHSMSLQREEILFFNLRQKSLESLDLRRKIINGERLDQPLTLRLVAPDTTEAHVLTSGLVDKFGQQNIILVAEYYPTLTLNKTILPERNYDLLLIGVDYGVDHDLYPYWHSSQIASPGFNFAGYRNKEVDRLLDEQRKQPDMAQRRQLCDQVKQLLASDAISLVVKTPVVQYVRSTRVKGTVPDKGHTAIDRWTDIENWYTKEKRVRKAQ